MSEPENFLTRWSRRKRVAEEPDQPAPAAGVAPGTTSPEGEPANKPESKAAAAPAPETSATPEPVFDPASLPSLDSIGAQTDIRAFLQAGVPNDLKLAALRRAWSADPAIRNFKGLAENDWDFNDPNGIMGFGKLDPGTDVKKMLAQLFGETPCEAEPPTALPAPAEQPALPPHDSEIAEPPQVESAGNDDMVQREENIAARDDDAEPDDAQIKRRRSQGSALPQ
jgi:hypothetical protein